MRRTASSSGAAAFARSANASVGLADGGRVVLRDSRKPGRSVEISPADWSEFVRGVKAGEFDELGAQAPRTAKRDGVCRLRPGERLEVDLSCLCLNCDFKAYRSVDLADTVCDHPDALPTISRCPQCPPPDAWPLSSRPAP
jgi:hypothetical protein